MAISGIRGVGMFGPPSSLRATIRKASCLISCGWPPTAVYHFLLEGTDEPGRAVPFTGGQHGLADNLQQKSRCCPEVPENGWVKHMWERNVRWMLSSITSSA